MRTSSERLQLATELEKGQKGIFWGSAIVAGLIISGLFLICFLLFLASGVFGFFGEGVVSSGFFFVTALLYCGSIFYSFVMEVNYTQFVSAMHERNAKLSDVFTKQHFWKKSALVILRYFFILLWSLIPFVGYFIGFYRHALTYKLFHLFPEKSVFQLLSEGTVRMNGHKWALFKRDVWQMIKMMFFGTITFGIAYIWLLPRYSIERSLHLDEILEA